MPRYFFEVSDEETSYADEEGMLYPTRDAAIKAGRQLAAELAVDLPELHGFVVIIFDEQGQVIDSVLVSPPTGQIQ